MQTADSREGELAQGGYDWRETNVGTQERVASAVTGALVALFGMRRGGFAGALMTLSGGSLLLRGLSGYCPAYAALGMNTAEARGYDSYSNEYGSREPSRPEAAGETGDEPGQGPQQGPTGTRPFEMRADEGDV